MEVQLNQSSLDKPLFILGHEWIMTSHIKPWVRLFIHKLIPVNPCLVRGEIPIKPCVVRGGISHYLNSSPPCAAYMRQWTGSALVQIMACRLFGAKPLPEPMLTYCRLDPSEQTSVKFELKIQNFSFKKMLLKRSSGKWRPFCFGINVLNDG